MPFQLVEVLKTELALESCRFADKWQHSIHIAVTFRRGKKSLCNWTFRGSCIVIYSYNKSQQDALFLRFI
jgi:hypothetical protein